MSNLAPSVASTNLGEKLVEANLAPNRITRTHLTESLKANILAEFHKGAGVDEITRRFGIGKSTAFQLRRDEFGPTRVVRRRSAVTEQNGDDTGISRVSLIRALRGPTDGKSDEPQYVRLSPQEARILAIVVRDTVVRLGSTNNDLRGKLATMALKLMG